MRKLLLILVILLVAEITQAADIHRTLGGTIYASDPNGWDLGRVPTFADNVFVDVINHCTINQSANWGNLYVGTLSPLGGTVDVRCSFRVSEDTEIGGEFATWGGIDISSGGSMLTGNLFIGNVGNGTLFLYGGDVWCINPVQIYSNGTMCIINNRTLWTPGMDCYGGHITFNTHGKISGW